MLTDGTRASSEVGPALGRRVVAALVVACLAGCSSESPVSPIHDPLLQFHPEGPFELWPYSTHPVIGRLKGGYPSLDELRSIVAMGDEQYASAQVDRMIHALSLIMNGEEFSTNWAGFAAVCQKAAKRKWAIYSSYLAGLTDAGAPGAASPDAVPQVRSAFFSELGAARLEFSKEGFEAVAGLPRRSSQEVLRVLRYDE